jgi:CHAT domain-containing protein/tetratricopeptide (TPR) repeat protein
MPYFLNHCIVILFLTLLVAVPARGQEVKTQSHQPSPSDKQALTLLVNKYFEALAGNHWEAIRPLIASSSQDLDERQLLVQKLLSKYKHIELKKVTIKNISIEEIEIPIPNSSNMKQTRAWIPVVVNITAIDIESNNPVAVLTNRVRAISCVKEGGTRRSVGVKSSSPQQDDRVWHLVSDLPDSAHIASTFTPSTSPELIRTLVALETRNAIKQIVRGLAQRAVQTSLRDGLPAGLVYFRMAHELDLESKRRRDEQKAERERAHLKKAEQKLQIWQDAVANPQKTDGPPLDAFEGGAWTMSEIANIHARSGDYSKALRYFLAADQPEALRLLALPSPPLGLTEDIAFAHAQELNYEESIRYFLRYVQERDAPNVRDRDLTDGIPRTLNKIGNLYLLSGEYGRAIEFHEKAIERLKQSIADPKLRMRTEMGYWSRGLIESVNEIAHVYEYQGNYESLQSTLKKIAAELESSGLIEEAATVQENLTEVLANVGTFTAALEHQERVIRFYERNQDKLKDTKDRIAAAQFVIGMLYLATGFNDRAVLYLTKAEEYFTKTAKDSDDEIVNRILRLFIGAIFALQGDDTLMPEMLKEIRSPIKSKPDWIWRNYTDNVFGTSVRLGEWFSLQDELDLAFESYQNAATFAESSDHQLLVIDRIRAIAYAFERNSNFSKALVAYKSAHTLSRQRCCNQLVLEDFFWASTKNRFRDLFEADWPDRLVEDVLRRDEAAKWRHHAQDPNSPGELMLRIAEILAKQDEYAKAIEAYNEGLKTIPVLTDNRSTQVFTAMADLYLRKGDLRNATLYAEKAAQATKKIDGPDQLFETSVIAGKVYMQGGDLVKAQQAFEVAKSTAERARIHAAGGPEERQFLFKDKLLPYHKLIELLLKKDQGLTALETAEQIKARLLVEVMQNGSLHLESAMTPNENTRNQFLQARLKTLTKETEQENNPIRRGQSELAYLKTRIEYAIFRLRVHANQVQSQKQVSGSNGVLERDVVSLLDQNTAVLEYVVTDDQVFLFVINKKSETEVTVHPFTLGIKKQELERKVGDFRKLVEEKSNNFRTSASDLYDILLGKAGAAIADKSAIIIIPDGILWNLPFQALQTPTQRYLIEDLVISYVPSLAALKELRRKHDERASRLSPRGQAGIGTEVGNGSLLAVGNPTLGRTYSKAGSQSSLCVQRDSLQPIPESEAEINQIVRLYKSGRTETMSYVGPAASESNVVRAIGNYQIVHLATHGVLDNRNPMDSYIVLSPNSRGTAQYGSLNARDMMTLKLKASLVVLSACETAGGRFGEGEGLLGMTWALAAAGTPTVVASQWPVNSCSTVDLMVEFHRRLRDRFVVNGPNLNVAENLRQASFALMRTDKYQHPFYWAGFIVVGDGR